MKQAKSVVEYIDASGAWKEAVILLRDTILSEGVEETIKWGAPTYTVNDKNIIGIGAFKSYVGLWFHQGALLKDEKKRLVSGTEGITKAQRQWRFSSVEEIKKDLEVLKAYVQEAIQNQKEGKEMKPVKKGDVVIPSELKELLATSPEIKKIFEAFPASHQREYAEYISEAKRQETRIKRIEKIRSMILNNSGLNDKYRHRS